MNIDEIKKRLFSNEISDEFITCCKNDPRPGVQKMVRKFEREAADRERVAKLYEYEYAARDEGLWPVAGVDEAGRGPLAGPVAASAVILPPGAYLPKLNDSKKVTPKNREILYDEIIKIAVSYHIELVSPEIIDRVNILQATVNGMYNSIFALDPAPGKVLIDAVELERLPMPSLSIIKGDAKSASIAAASILAKVTRDRLMDEYDKKYPEYGFKNHKGYGTAEHIAALKKYGPCPIHRRSFEPVKTIVSV